MYFLETCKEAELFQLVKHILKGDQTSEPCAYMIEMEPPCNNANEAKRLGCHIAGFDMKRWINDGYSLCYDGIHAKFIQNRNLLMMLKSTAPKVLVEATLDRLWGTGIILRDHQALNPDKWHNKGWMSTMLMGIRDEPTH